MYSYLRKIKCRNLKTTTAASYWRLLNYRAMKRNILLGRKPVFPDIRMGGLTHGCARTVISSQGRQLNTLPDLPPFLYRIRWRSEDKMASRNSSALSDCYFFTSTWTVFNPDILFLSFQGFNRLIIHTPTKCVWYIVYKSTIANMLTPFDNLTYTEYLRMRKIFPKK